jgi:hypothetical protein
MEGNPVLAGRNQERSGLAGQAAAQMKHGFVAIVPDHSLTHAMSYNQH